MDLIEFIQLLLRRKWLILTVTSVAVITTFAITQVRHRVYAATAQLATSENADQLAGLNGTIDNRGKYEDEARINNLTEMIKSRPVVSLTSYELALHDLNLREAFRNMDEIRVLFSEGEIETAKKNFQIKLDSMLLLVSSDELERKHIRMLEELGYDYNSLSNNLDVSRVPGTGFIEISFKSESPFLSAFVVNSLAKQFIRYHQAVRTRQARNSIQFYTLFTEEKRQVYHRALESMDQSSSAPVEPSLKASVEEITRLEIARLETMTRIQTLEVIAGDLQNQLSQPERNAVDKVEALQERQLIDWRLSISRLNDDYVDSRFGAEALNSLQEVQGSMSDYLQSKAVGQIKGATPEQTERVKRLFDAQVGTDMLRDRLRSYDRVLSDIRRLTSAPAATGQEDQINRVRNDYLVALNKLNNARLASISQESEISLVSQVQPPDFPEPTRVFTLMVIAALAGFALCVIIIFFLEYIDVSLRFPSVFTEITGIPLLGALPRLPRANLNLIGLFQEKNPNEQLETYKHRVRQLRAEIMESGAQTFLVVSPRQGFGKTSVMVSLAYSLSLNHKKVLIVDSNMKSPSLTKITGAAPNLEEILGGNMSLNQGATTQIFDGVEVMGIAGGDATPMEMFPPERWIKFMEDARKRFDVVLMEGPAMNEFADARELVPLVDKVIVVFSATAYVHDIDKATFDYLKSYNGRLMGAILNQVEMVNLNR